MTSGLLCSLLVCVPLLAAEPGVFVTLWFDTEDYIEPSDDDATLRLALDLEKLGVRATFKIVGEKARVLESRGRTDVIRALSRHDIGYHSENHSLQPTPAVYLREMGWLDGAAEFERREGQGVADIRRIFGVTPGSYGQPGSSWGPQSYRALRRMGIPVYLDEGSHVRVDEQAFWLGNVLHVFGLGKYVLRASLREGDRLEDTLARFDQAAEELRKRGGGMISIYYHPNEWVTTEFWDGVNFSRGARPERDQWVRPKTRTKEDSERCFQILTRYVEHMKKAPDVQFVTASEFPRIYASQISSKPPDRVAVARHMADRQTFFDTGGVTYSAAEILLVLLGIEPMEVEGPVARRKSTLKGREISRTAFVRAKADVVSFIRVHRGLPAEVWIGAEYLSLPDFAATLAADSGAGPVVSVRSGNPEMEKYIATDPVKTFNWVIHPEGFSAPGLLELARLQAWTLKPARLR